MERARFFQRQNVGCLFDHAQKIDITRRVGANFADLICGEETATNARAHRLPRRRNGARNLLGLIAARLHHPERDAFRRARTHARHFAKLLDQIPDRGRILRLPQSERRLLVQRHVA